MDSSQILVAILVGFAIGWLIWAERHSRRNTTAEAEKAASHLPPQPESPAESKPHRRRRAA